MNSLQKYPSTIGRTTLVSIALAAVLTLSACGNNRTNQQQRPTGPGGAAPNGGAVAQGDGNAQASVQQLLSQWRFLEVQGSGSLANAQTQAAGFNFSIRNQPWFVRSGNASNAMSVEVWPMLSLRSSASAPTVETPMGYLGAQGSAYVFETASFPAAAIAGLSNAGIRSQQIALRVYLAFSGQQYSAAQSWAEVIECQSASSSCSATPSNLRFALR